MDENTQTSAYFFHNHEFGNTRFSRLPAISENVLYTEQNINKGTQLGASNSGIHVAACSVSSSIRAGRSKCGRRVSEGRGAERPHRHHLLIPGSGFEAPGTPGVVPERAWDNESREALNGRRSLADSASGSPIPRVIFDWCKEVRSLSK